MRVRFFAWALGACAWLAAATAAGAATPPPLAAYGRLPSASHVVISPDGSRLALIAGEGKGAQLQIRAFSDLKPVAVQVMDDFKIRSLRWAGPDHLLITVSTSDVLAGEFMKRLTEWYQVLDLDIPHNKLTALFANVHTLPHDTLNVVTGSPYGVVINGRPTALVEGIVIPERKAQVALFRIDLNSGSIDQVGDTNAKVRSWILDASGKPIARSLYDQSTTTYSLELASGGGWRTVFSADAPVDTPYVPGLGHEPDSVLLRQMKDGVWSTYEVKAGATGIGPSLAGFDDGDIISEPSTGRPIGFVDEDTDGVRYRFLDPKDQTRWAAIVRAFPGEVVQLLDWSDDRTKIALMVSGKENGAAYYLVDMATHKATFLADRYAGLPAEAFNEQKSIAYSAQDGLTIHAFLTLPRDRGAKNLPLVVLPHGGPQAQDSPGFDWWSQALASRGYAVLQPQFRGSTGYGHKFVAAGYGEWGKKMQTDLSDGVAELARQGVVDPKRVCIVGASYGGYAALAGVALQSGVYRCAVSVAGPADLKALIDESTKFSNERATTSTRYWNRFMGIQTSADPSLAARSPALMAAQVNAPLLLIHGRDDTVVRYEQSQKMAAAMQRAGKPVQFVTLDQEDHWLSRGDTRLRMLTETLNFLQANNPP